MTKNPPQLSPDIRRIRNFYGPDAFFLLDSACPGSLTLRDYSKVVAGHKQSFSKKKQTFPKMSGGPMASLRTRWSQLCLSGICLALSLVVANPLFAQGTGGRILGRVSDPSGAVLANTKITATNDATGVNHDAVSNDSGDFEIG